MPDGDIGEGDQQKKKGRRQKAEGRSVVLISLHGSSNTRDAFKESKKEEGQVGSLVGSLCGMDTGKMPMTL